MTATTRDDFPNQIKRQLAQRVRHSCSLPECQAPTSGPSDERNDAVNNVGVAAHITAAAPGGPRYDASLTAKDRSSIENGIWLCQTCAKKVDGDEVTWTVAVLRDAKAEAERRAKLQLGKSNPGAGEGLQLESAVCVYIRPWRAAYVAVELVNRGDAQDIKSVQLMLEGVLFGPSQGRADREVKGCNWLAPPPSRVERNGTLTGAWYFGWSFDSGGTDVDVGPEASAQLKLVPVLGPPIERDLKFDYVDDPRPQAAPIGRTTASPMLPAHVDLDRRTFSEHDSLMPEAALMALLDRLCRAHDYCDADIASVDDFLQRTKLESHRFADTRLNTSLDALRSALAELNEFLASRFHVYPQRQLGQNLRHALMPDLSPDRGVRTDAAARDSYDRLTKELDDRAATTKREYRAHRAAVRLALAV